jgi:hypothetical protein
MKFHTAIFGGMFCAFGIGALLTALFKAQPWYVRYVQVAIGLTSIVLGDYTNYDPPGLPPQGKARPGVV